jgi:hypothetical protein
MSKSFFGLVEERQNTAKKDLGKFRWVAIESSVTFFA